MVRLTRAVLRRFELDARPVNLGLAKEARPFLRLAGLVGFVGLWAAVLASPSASGQASGQGSGQGPSAAPAYKDSVNATGHLKLQGIGSYYSDESLFGQAIGSTALDTNFDLRFNLDFDWGRWDLDIETQIQGLAGDTFEFNRQDSAGLFGPRLPTDELKLFRLSRVRHDGESLAVLTQVDRLSLSYTGKRTVVRLGRQAVSWGNGFIYNPMDIFNPFNPTAVDKEFKPGDDMFYAQYLFGRGDDLQSVVVFRRDPLTGRVEENQGSAALKYHGFVGAGEFDLLLAEHYDDRVYAAGGNTSLGGAIWRGDVIVTKTPNETFTSGVTSLSYSWIMGGKNMSGVLEYFYNDFGIESGDYSPASLLAHPELLARVIRGELFNLGRDYVAASVTIELSPLFLITPNVFANLSDPSALLQVVFQNDLKQDLILQTSVTVPFGSKGTEFGGIPALDPEFESYLSNEASFFVQLAWYF